MYSRLCHSTIELELPIISEIINQFKWRRKLWLSKITTVRNCRLATSKCTTSNGHSKPLAASGNRLRPPDQRICHVCMEYKGSGPEFKRCWDDRRDESADLVGLGYRVVAYEIMKMANV